MNDKAKSAWRRPETDATPGSLKRPLRYRNTPANPDHSLFIEKLCLALIDAHPSLEPGGNTESERQRRLNDAVAALIGCRIGDGRPPKYDLTNFFRAYCTRNGDGEVRTRPPQRNLEPYHNVALLYLATNKNVDSSGDTNPFDSSTGSSDLIAAATRARRATSNKNDANRLEAKFDEYAEYLLSVAAGQNLDEEGSMIADLQTVSAVLSRWGIQVSIDPVKLGLASLWDETA